MAGLGGWGSKSIGGHLGFIKGSPVWMASLRLNMVSGLRSFHVGQAAKQSLAHRLGDLKTTVLTMSPFSLVGILCFFN